MGSIWLLAALFFCHWLGDYTHLTRPYMLVAKKLGKPFIPILTHGIIHGLLMLTILLIFGTDKFLAYQLFVFQYATHTCIDILKGRLNGWFPKLQDVTKPAHWYVFGLDQFAHTLVILIMWNATIVPLEPLNIIYL